MQKIALFSLLVFITTILPTVTHGQEVRMPDPNKPAVIPEKPANFTTGTTANTCFSYYQFNSVKTNLVPATTAVVSGSDASFSGFLVNENDYPIVDGTLLVKIFRPRTNRDESQYGPDVVDEFVALHDVTLPAKGTIPITVRWKVPAHLTSGSYALATFFSTSRKFNLLGLSFTDDVVGQRVPFTVTGEQSGSVAFDKTSVAVNGKPYFFAAFPPRVSQKEPFTITAHVRNTTSADQTARIEWTVYQWDAQLRENAVQEKSVHVPVASGKTETISLTVTDAAYPVYYVVGRLTWKDTTSIIGIRAVRMGVDRVRINFPGITEFPLKKDVPVTLFSCLHNSGEAARVQDTTLDLTLTDEHGNSIYQKIYKGSVTGEMMGISETFTPNASYNRVHLDARLYQGGVYVDEANLVYDCTEIDPERCLIIDDSENSSTLSTYRSLIVSQYGLFALPIIGGLLILLTLYLFFRRRQQGVSQR